jgi:hypothetical protein
MSEESSKRNRRTRRIAARQNKPVLVTGDTEQQGTTVATASTETEQEEETIPASETKVVQPRRGFLSVIGKRSESGESQKMDATQARLARATRARKGEQQPAAAEEGKQEETQPEKKPVRAATRAPQRPPSAFKFRYIIGMFVYVMLAELLGGYEVNLVHNSSLERELFTFNLFGGKAVIDTSTVVYLATLIVLLVVLARFDLIPRSLSSASASPARQTQQSASSQGSEPVPKFTPPPVRQGVRGESDELYRQYLDNKRKEKKK